MTAWRDEIEIPDFARLVELWEQWRGDRALAHRSALTPDRVRFLLGDLAVVDLEREAFRARYRLVGTNLVELWGRELQGHTVDDVYPERFAREAMAAYAEVARTLRPLYSRRLFDLGFRKVGYHRLMVPFHDGDPARVDAVALALRPANRDVRGAKDWARFVEDWRRMADDPGRAEETVNLRIDPDEGAG